jgi:hypothetical protein
MHLVAPPRVSSGLQISFRVLSTMLRRHASTLPSSPANLVVETRSRCAVVGVSSDDVTVTNELGDTSVSGPETEKSSYLPLSSTGEHDPSAWGRYTVVMANRSASFGNSATLSVPHEPRGPATRA